VTWASSTRGKLQSTDELPKSCGDAVERCDSYRCDTGNANGYSKLAEPTATAAEPSPAWRLELAEAPLPSRIEYALVKGINTWNCRGTPRKRGTRSPAD